ncbi:GNAT family N-acetyltransferase [Gottschalkiaceae bacterium SANA]|nr:GNAT family N-acetyltransferase [Gottschalkiaceae bacterium SANA]
MLIREGNINDAKAMIAYLDAVAVESDNLTFEPGELKITIEIEEKILEQAQKSEKDVFYLAMENDKIVGNLNFHASTRKRIAHVGEFGISVRKSHWGQGIGGKLLDQLLLWAPKHGIRKINLRVRADNEAAIRLYEKKGFCKEGHLKCEYIIDGICIDHLAMGLVLEPQDGQ